MTLSLFSPCPVGLPFTSLYMIVSFLWQCSGWVLFIDRLRHVIFLLFLIFIPRVCSIYWVRLCESKQWTGELFFTVQNFWNNYIFLYLPRLLFPWFGAFFFLWQCLAFMRNRQLNGCFSVLFLLCKTAETLFFSPLLLRTLRGSFLFSFFFVMLPLHVWTHQLIGWACFILQDS